MVAGNNTFIHHLLNLNHFENVFSSVNRYPEIEIENLLNFSDLDLNFTLLDGSNDVGLKTDVEAVKQSIRSLILTRHYERPFQSYIGSALGKQKFHKHTRKNHNIYETIFLSIL